ncbi:MAG TPA: UDP-N-acetylmuramate--L-alanine ligase [Acidimicrobiia bacterium]|nr:UDP-N-acetylmuramate--L-alanine ligase [Acidimicrobiia bacterium]
MTDLPQRIHIVGIGGAGMSALAKILAGRGYRLTGSDLRAGTATDLLSALGIEVWEGSRPERISQVDLVVASSAVPESDSELDAARRAGVPVWRRPELLEVMTSKWPVIGPTGTHGKTTTTALLVTAIRSAGADPSFVAGGELVAFGTNGHLGGDDLLVLEVDEAFGTFEHVRLRGLVVTNVEQDHMDHFGSQDELEEAFVRVARSVDGPVVACLDDPGAAGVATRVGSATYGISPDATWRIRGFTADDGTGRFRLVGPRRDVAVTLPRPGLHLARNAAGALALLGELGYDLDAAAAGLEHFAGVRRRFESKGTISGVRVIDDYAHHPTEVAATLREAAQYQPSRLWAVFQPHLYSRTRDLHREFGASLALADRVVVTDVYGAREEPIPGVTGQLVASAARRAGAPWVQYLPHRADVAARVAELAAPGDMVVVMGAGDITLTASELAQALQPQMAEGSA